MSQVQIGQRIHHRCKYPDCPLFGTVIDFGSFWSNLTDGTRYFDWVLVEWDEHRGEVSSIPRGYRQWVPKERLEPA